MIKKPITYTDYFTEEEVTKDYYFHLNESELLMIQAKSNGEISNQLEGAIEMNNMDRIFNTIKEMILMSYGERDDNGNFFKVKNRIALRENFEASPAFDALMMELTSDPNAGEEFIVGIMPSGVKKKISPEDMKILMSDPSKVKEIITKDKN